MRNNTPTLADAINAICETQKQNPDCLARPDLNRLEALKRDAHWLLSESYRGPMNSPRHHQVFDRIHASLKTLEKKCSDYHYRKKRREVMFREEMFREEMLRGEKFNPNHKPAGSPNGSGGEFDVAPGGGGGGSSPSGGEGIRKPSVGERIWQETFGSKPAAADEVPKPKPRPAYPPVPTYPTSGAKPGIKPVSDADWQTYHDNLAKGPKVSQTEQGAHAKIFAMEGGYQSDGETYAGITPDALNDAKNGAVLKDTLKDINAPTDLDKNRELVPHIYKDHLDRGFSRVGGSAALDEVGNAHAAAAMADVVFREGRTGGAQTILNAITATDPDLGYAVSPTGKADSVGPATLHAYSQLAKDPATLGSLLDNVAAARKAGKYGNETNRINYFQFEKERKK